MSVNIFYMNESVASSAAAGGWVAALPSGPGTLSVHIHEARKLEKKGVFGKVRTNHSPASGHVTPSSPPIGQADPYVLITLGGTKTQTKTVANSQSPVWDFVARLGVDSPAAADTLLLQVMISRPGYIYSIYNIYNLISRFTMMTSARMTRWAPSASPSRRYTTEPPCPGGGTRWRNARKPYTGFMAIKGSRSMSLFKRTKITDFQLTVSLRAEISACRCPI